MKTDDLKKKVLLIVEKATALKDKHIGESAPVNYACIFSQNQAEYEELVDCAKEIGNVVKQTPNGPLFQISLQTGSGVLKLLKIRMPDPTRPELGDADFTIRNFLDFEKKYLQKRGFKLIPRENFRMIELMDPDFDVRAYFSYPPLDEQLGI